MTLMTVADNPLRQRAALLSAAAHNVALQQLLTEQFRRDPKAFCNAVVWTLDPRESPVIRPFVLYPFQQDTLDSLHASAQCGEDVLIEKSRDMGVSWLVLAWMLHQWLFSKGSQFLVGSRKLDYVDNPGDPTSLFEKLRFMLRQLPPWLLPKGFTVDKHATKLRLRNPATGSVIVGESANPQFSRGGRYKAIFMDEFPFWANDDTAWAAAGQSSPCRMVVGTPYGKHNTFARLRFEGQIKVLTLHWRRHPHKNAEWYAQQTRRLSPDEIARELDINYNLSVANRVFPHFGEEHKAEVLEPIEGKRLVRVWDFGYHCPCCVVLQVDGDGQVRVLHEMVGHQEVLKPFAQRVLQQCQSDYPDWPFEDLCDPAGSQKSDKSDHTSIDILNSLGVYPYHERTRIQRGLELIRHKLLPQASGQVGLVVHRRCTNLIDAFEGGYRYASPQHEVPLEEHPFEDVMDCLRYGVIFKCDFEKDKTHKRYRPPTYRSPPATNPYTGY
ncbi:MAG: hypothetical protein QE263_02520 [Vampirovibrionales bacterium]|nr:hypothetical protein [Vampirovibrionales bacterium]